MDAGTRTAPFCAGKVTFFATKYLEVGLTPKSKYCNWAPTNRPESTPVRWAVVMPAILDRTSRLEKRTVLCGDRRSRLDSLSSFEVLGRPTDSTICGGSSSFVVHQPECEEGWPESFL